MKALLLSLLCSACITTEAGTKEGPKIGDEAPLLEASKVLQAAPGAELSPNSFRGKVVILEFWATWCGPCVSAIPHLNQLADEFKEKPVQFVAITDETETTVKAFLLRRPIHAWVALDSDKTMNNAYGVRSIPRTVLLDKQGRVAGTVHPRFLTAQAIKDLLAGKKITLKEPADGVDQGASQPEQSPALFEIMVRPSTLTHNSCGFGPTGLSARASTVSEMLPFAFDATPARIRSRVPLPHGRYDFTILHPGDSEEETRSLLRQTLLSVFGLIARRETNDEQVFLLKVKELKPGLVVSPTPNGTFRYGPGEIGGMDVSMSGLARALEGILKQPVIDETGLTSHYDFNLVWGQKSADEPNLDQLKKELREQLGLDLLPAIRSIETVQIEPVKGVSNADTK